MAIASLDLFHETDALARSRAARSAGFARGLEPLRALPIVGDVRVHRRRRHRRAGDRQERRSRAGGYLDDIGPRLTHGVSRPRPAAAAARQRGLLDAAVRHHRRGGRLGHRPDRTGITEEVEVEVRGWGQRVYLRFLMQPPCSPFNTWRDVMKRFAVLTCGLAALVAAAACGQPAGTLAAAADALKASDTKSIEYSGTGKWFQFGQAPSADAALAAVRRHAYTASINYEAPAARVQMTRKQTVEPGARPPGARRAEARPVHQRHVRLEHGGACRRSRRRCSRRAAAAGRGRRADDGDLVDASGLPARRRRPTTPPPRPPTADPR